MLIFLKKMEEKIMGYTPFAEFVRILRIRHHQVMGDMAKILNTSTPFLSAVENGKKNVPEEWIKKITDYYHLSIDEQNELIKSIEESKSQYKISVGNASTSRRKVAVQFARSFDEIDDETALKILELLKKGEKKE